MNTPYAPCSNLEQVYDLRTASSSSTTILRFSAALVAFGSFSPDAVLLDVNLPDTSGIDLLAQMKMYSEAAAVIVMSGQGTHDVVIEAMKLGAETFLQKERQEQ